MYMVMFVLHDPGLLRDVLEAWDSVGVCGVTIIASTGRKRLLAHDLLREDMPLIPSIEDIFEDGETTNRTLFSVIKDEGLVDRLVKVTQDIVGDFNQPNTGILTVLPVVRAYGLHKRSDS